MAGIYMLDTDICSYIIRGNYGSIDQALAAHENDDICISNLTYAELWFGTMKKGSPRLAAQVAAFIRMVRVVEMDTLAAVQYAAIRCTLEAKGTPLDPMDMLIAACALAAGAVLITNNQKHFSQIKDLKTENWRQRPAEK
ncbi:ribonuclease VapC [Alphaproteobacteria bacterium]|nr:ribonuclease VapC [Alphaproteobacteria bacterium]